VTFGSLFAGIGGFDLGLERAGMQCEWQCEIDPYARRVLEKHWPDVRRYDDVRTMLDYKPHAVDLICGGFPCQDISNAGRRAGIDGERSGLWSEYARIIGTLRPRYVLVENVAALLGRGIGRVLGDLSSLGYDAEWHVISAASVGAPHVRERVWIVANRDSSSGRAESWEQQADRAAIIDPGCEGNVADTHGIRLERAKFFTERLGVNPFDSDSGCEVSNSESERAGQLSVRQRGSQQTEADSDRNCKAVSDTDR
jgi:DNA (cytosine-5)-methyltransferase 1